MNELHRRSNTNGVVVRGINERAKQSQLSQPRYEVLQFGKHGRVLLYDHATSHRADEAESVRLRRATIEGLAQAEVGDQIDREKWEAMGQIDTAGSRRLMEPLYPACNVFIDGGFHLGDSMTC